MAHQQKDNVSPPLGVIIKAVSSKPKRSMVTQLLDTLVEVITTTT